MVSHFSTIMPADPSVVDKLPTRMPWKVLEYPPDSPELSPYYKRAFLLLSLWGRISDNYLITQTHTPQFFPQQGAPMSWCQ